MGPRTYTRVFTEPFLEDLRAHRKNRGLLRRVEEKVNEVLGNPEHYKPLRAPLQGSVEPTSARSFWSSKFLKIE